MEWFGEGCEGKGEGESEGEGEGDGEDEGWGLGWDSYYAVFFFLFQLQNKIKTQFVIVNKTTWLTLASTVFLICWKAIFIIEDIFAKDYTTKDHLGRRFNLEDI